MKVLHINQSDITGEAASELINRSWGYRVLAKFSEMLAESFIEGLAFPETLPNGRSVIAVYRKSKSKC